MPLENEPPTNPFIHDQGIYIVDINELKLSIVYQSATRPPVDDFVQDMEQPYYASPLGWILPRP